MQNKENTPSVNPTPAEKPDNNEENNIEENTETGEYEEEIIAKKATNIDGFEILEFNKNLNGKDFKIKIAFDSKNETETINGEVYDKQVVLYQIYLNDYLVENASGKYNFDSGSEADAYAIDIKDSDIKILKGQDNKEYLVIVAKCPNITDGIDKHYVYIINEFARLIGILTLDRNVLMHKLDGSNSDNFLISNEYHYYVILNDKILYLNTTAIDSSATNIGYDSYELTIKYHKITNVKKTQLTGSDYEDDGFGSVTLKTY